jgi:prepilin-type N-terminal cleavage/methylation domain-containing protein
MLYLKATSAMKNFHKVNSFVHNGFTITETIIATTIVGLLSAVAIPNYVGQLCRAESSEAETTIGSIQSIIAAFVDETSELPTTWNELTNIAAIMTNNGQAKGNLSTAITLPNEKYSVAVTGPTDSTYEISALRTDGCPNRDMIACLDLSNGASDLERGDGTTNAATPICT